MQTTIGRHLKRFRRNRRGISNIIVVALSLIVITIIVSNIVLWSYQMNQLDWEKMKEDVAITNVERATRSSWFVAQSEYTVNMGSRASGTYVDTQSIDTSFESFNETTQAQSYYPSSFNLLSSTKQIGGSLSDLQSDNGVYMNFNSYASAFSTTDFSRATISYRSNTGTGLNSPKNREWDGTVWDSSETEIPSSGSPVRWVRVAYSPVSGRYYEKIVVTLSNNGYLDAFVWDGSSWLVTNDIGYVGTTANARRAFDIAYEETSGKAMLVYAISSTSTTQDLAYKTWDGTAWSTESYIDDTGHATNIQYYWVTLASKQTSSSNEIALVGIDGTDSDVVAWIWNGSTWSNMNELTATASIATEEDAAVAYETISGNAIFAYGVSGANIQSKIWAGTTWNNTASILSIDGSTANWITMKNDPSSNQVMLVSVDGSSDLNTFLWRASPMAWERGTGTDHDTSVDTNAQRCADFAWEPTGSKGLLVWGTNPGNIAYKTFTAPNTWGTQQNPAMGALQHVWVQLRTNPRSVSGDVKILGAVLENTNFDLGAIRWDGSALTVIGSSTFSADTTVATYECFEIEFLNFGSPIGFTVEVEFTGASDTETWTQLVWTIDSAWTSSSVSVTLQLFNSTLGSYPTSGNGYMNYTSTTMANTDETKSQTITENPTHFRNATGYWKIKVKGFKAGTASFDFKADLVVFSPKTANNCRLDLNGTFAVDLSTYPLAYIQTVEILVRYRASDAGENWYLSAYNWTASAYSYTGFNTTAGDMPTMGWDNYAVNLTSSWQSYVANNGTMYVKFVDGTPDNNSTTIDIDFLGIRAIFDGTNFTLKNAGSLTSHVVSLWIVNSTLHKHYDADVILISAETYNYIRADVKLPSGTYSAKVVTEKGNTAVYSS